MKTQVRTSHIVVINEKSEDPRCRKPIPVTFLKLFARLYCDERVKVVVHPGCISTSLALPAMTSKSPASVVVAHAQANW